MRFLSNEHVKKASITVTPGPAAYDQRPVVCELSGKKQASTLIRTSPKYGFGTAVRFDNVKDRRTASVPGPGAYVI